MILTGTFSYNMHLPDFEEPMGINLDAGGAHPGPMGVVSPHDMVAGHCLLLVTSGHSGLGVSRWPCGLAVGHCLVPCDTGR